MRLVAGRLPLIEPGDDPDVCADELANFLEGDFCLAAFPGPDRIASLAAAGFMPLAIEENGVCLLTPKLHERRSILNLTDFKPGRTARRIGRRYTMTTCAAFDHVVESCALTHGEAWLLPPLREAFKALFRRGGQPRFASFELYREGRLVAGEFGYAIGSCYASLSGFRIEDSAGSVQLACAGALLRRAGFRAWDLGMPMEYKARLGAVEVDRHEFIRELRACRDEAVEFPIMSDLVGARAILGWERPAPSERSGLECDQRPRGP